MGGFFVSAILFSMIKMTSRFPAQEAVTEAVSPKALFSALPDTGRPSYLCILLVSVRMLSPPLSLSPSTTHQVFQGT